MLVNRFCWLSRSSSAWMRRTWSGYRPASIAFARCRCPMSWPVWLRKCSMPNGTKGVRRFAKMHTQKGSGLNRSSASCLPCGSMLRELSVQNLALIEDLRIELQPGFCAWSGETGAGKTLLLEGLGLLLGERGSAEILRSGADELRVIGRFELTRAELRTEAQTILEQELDEPQVILARRLTRAGRSYAYVNEQPVALSTLRRLGAILVDIHGQRETQSLLQPAYQMRLLDSFGDLDAHRQRYEDLAQTVRQLRRQLDSLDDQRQRRQRELALLRFEREELDSAALQPGELAELSRERERLANAQT